MTIKDFAQQLNGKEYDSCMFLKSELQTAKDNGWVIVTGASDDLMEFDGAIHDEAGCCAGGKVYFSKYNVAYNGEDDMSIFPNCIEACWFDKSALGDDENVIPWTYKTDIPHETFMVYEDGDPYCRGIVFAVEDLK